MLKLKSGPCLDCPPGTPHRILIADRCRTHYWAHRRKKANAKGLILSPDERQMRDALGMWYNYHNASAIWICENCGEPLQPYSPSVMSSCQAHIIPKDLFPSVQGVIENHLTLGGVGQNCNCHYKYDYSWEFAIHMPVFVIAKQRFIKFKHLISPGELKKLPEVFQALF